MNFDPKDIFFSSFMTLVQGCHTFRGCAQLDHVLKSWNFKKISVPADGDCLFTAIALAITNRVEQGDNLVMKRLATLGITHPNVQNVQFIQQLLRTEMVSNGLIIPSIKAL